MPTRTWARRGALALVGCALWYAAPSPAPAQDDLSAIKRQIEQQNGELERQQVLLDQLRAQLGQVNQPTAAPAADPSPAPAGPTVEEIVRDYLRRRDEATENRRAADAAKAEEDGYKVGTDLRLNVAWNPLNGVTFATPHKDFVAHMGVWFQYDSVAWDQSPALRAPGQMGDLQDGSFFRRIRPTFDGQAWEIMEWNVILALEQVNNDVPDIDECWVGLMNLPVVGSVRIGKTHVPQGLESGTVTLSKAQTFMEESSFTDAFYENLAVGVWTGNSVLDQRLTWAAMAYRQDSNSQGSDAGQNGVSFGDGKWGYSGRISGLPLWENDGRTLLHLAASATWRKAEDVAPPPGVQPGTVGPTFIDFRARPQMRDAIGDFGGTNGNNATPVGLSGNSKRLVDTGMLDASSCTILGTELLYIRGPFSLQAEYAWASANDTVVANRRVGDLWFHGGYVQLSYFLTGENRLYDRRLGRLATNYISSPYTPFYLTRGEDGRWLWGRGAWELAARWNHLDLNDGPILGGQTDALELGINWHLNSNLKIMFEYLHQDRYNKTTAPNGTLPGDVDGFGIRTQFFF